jgi:hypothetical protein
MTHPDVIKLFARLEQEKQEKLVEDQAKKDATIQARARKKEEKADEKAGETCC